MQNKLHTTETDQLFEAITLLENIEDCYRFFEDICTINEIQSFVQRFQVAKMLRENKIYRRESTSNLSCLDYPCLAFLFHSAVSPSAFSYFSS